MNRRLEQFLAAENISQSQFADKIGVARASVSHILAGRNKPGFDFLESMSRHFPTLNLEWLIMGLGKMYKNPSGLKPEADSVIDTKATEANSELLFPIADDLLEANEAEAQKDSPKQGKRLFSDSITSEKTSNTYSNTIINRNQSIKNQRSITKIIVYFDDNTFQELK